MTPLAEEAGIDLDLLGRRLRGRAARPAFRLLRPRRAAVAIALDEAARVLLVRRAARRGDRWSSQVALPGGMQHPDDASLRATAERETREEVGVDLGSAEHLGALDELRAVANGGLWPMSIAPFVYLLREPVQPTTSAEVARAFWLPLASAARGELDDTLRWPVLGLRLRFACFSHDGERVWGLTYAILQRLLAIARPRAPAAGGADRARA